MEVENVLSAAVLSMLLMDLIKLIIRKAKKDMLFEFPAIFYAVGIPLLNVFTPFVLFWLGVAVDSPVLGMGWLELLKYAVVVALGSVVTFFGYNLSIKPLKDYETARKERVDVG